MSIGPPIARCGTLYLSHSCAWDLSSECGGGDVELLEWNRLLEVNEATALYSKRCIPSVRRRAILLTHVHGYLEYTQIHTGVPFQGPTGVPRPSENAHLPRTPLARTLSKGLR